MIYTHLFLAPVLVKFSMPSYDLKWFLVYGHMDFAPSQSDVSKLRGATKEDIDIEQKLYEIVRGKNFAVNCLS